MRFSSFSGPPARAKRSIRLAHYCWQLALALCIVGLLPGLLALWGQQKTVTADVWRDPADGLDARAVALDLTLLSLAGTPDREVLTLAIEKGEAETVRALLAHSPDLTDQRRLNGWLWLAQHYREANDTQRAAHAYHMVGTGAILGDPLPDLLRVESLLTAGQALLVLHDGSSASFYLKQAALLGGLAPRITDYHRRSLLERLVPLILRAGGEREDWADLAQAVEYSIVQGGQNYYNRSPSTDSIELGVPKGFDAALVQARDVRRGAAASWLTALFADPGTDIVVQPELRQQLSEALLAEDAAVAGYVRNYNGLEAAETRVRWLLLKRRILSGAGSSSLVHEWDASREQVHHELTGAWASWLALQTDASDSNPGQRANAARRALMAAYWGLYPDAPITDLVPATHPVPGPSSLRLTIIKPGTLPLVGWSKVSN